MSDSQESQEEENGLPTGSGQVLPVAVLPDDFDGEAEDGAVYLALAARENDKRPFVTRIDPPPPPPRAVEVSNVQVARHPVLPTESWIVVFCAHFAAYRAHLSERLTALRKRESDVQIPGNIEGWLAYIDGAPEQIDEEEAFNEAADMDVEWSPRDPLLSVVARIDTRTNLKLLKNLIPTHSLPPHRGKWLFALLSVLDPHLDCDDLSTLRYFARCVIDFISRTYTARMDELVDVPVYPGFYGGDSGSLPVLGEVGGLNEVGRSGWKLGAARKRNAGNAPKSEVQRPEHGTSVDDEITRAWVAVFAVVGGWTQKDLVEECEKKLGRLPLS